MKGRFFHKKADLKHITLLFIVTLIFIVMYLLMQKGILRKNKLNEMHET